VNWVGERGDSYIKPPEINEVKLIPFKLEWVVDLGDKALTGLLIADYLGRKGLRLACMIDLPRPPENWVYEVNREFFWEPALDDRSRHG